MRSDTHWLTPLVMTGTALLMTTGCASESGFTAPARASSDRSPEQLQRAAEVGVDLSSGNPSRNRERLLGIFDRGETTDITSLAFTGGFYSDPESGQPFSGYASAVYNSGRPRSIHGIVDGQLEGPGMWLFEDGSIHFATRYLGGEMSGQILEFNADGNMKLRAMSHGIDPEGGLRVGEITVGLMGPGGYSQRQLGTGRIRVTREDGTPDRTNALIAVPDQHGYMLFYDRRFGGEARFTHDDFQNESRQGGA